MLDLAALEDGYNRLQTVLQANLAQEQVRKELSRALALFLDILPCLKLDSRILVKFKVEDRERYDDLTSMTASALIAYFSEICSVRHVASVCNRVFMPYHCVEIIQPEIMRLIFWSYSKGSLTDLDILSYCNMVVTGAYLTTFHCDTTQILNSNTKSASVGPRGAKSSTAHVLDPRNAYYDERQRISNSLLPTLAVFKAEVSSTSLSLSNECYMLLLAAELVNKLYHLELIPENELEYESLCARSLGLVVTIFNNVWLRIANSGMELSEVWQLSSVPDGAAAQQDHQQVDSCEEQFDLMSLQTSTNIDLERYRQFLAPSGNTPNPLALSTTQQAQSLASTAKHAPPDVQLERVSANTIAEKMLDQNELGAMTEIYPNLPKSPPQLPTKVNRRHLIMSKSTQNLRVVDVSTINPGLPQANIRDPTIFNKLNNEDAIHVIENSLAASEDIVVMMCKVACDLLVATAEYQKKVAFQDSMPNDILAGGLTLKTGQESSSNGCGSASVCTRSKATKFEQSSFKSGNAGVQPGVRSPNASKDPVEDTVDRSKTVSAYTKLRKKYNPSMLPYTLDIIKKNDAARPSDIFGTERRNLPLQGTRFNRVEVGKRYAPGTVGAPTYINDLTISGDAEKKARKAWLEAPYNDSSMQLNCFINYNTVTHIKPGSGTVRLPTVALYPPIRSLTLSKMRTQNLTDYIRTLTETYYYSMYTSFSSWSSIRHSLLSIIYVRAMLIRDIFSIRSFDDACYFFATESTVKQAISATFIGRAIVELFNYVSNLGAITVKDTNFMGNRLDNLGETMNGIRQKAKLSRNKVPNPSGLGFKRDSNGPDGFLLPEADIPPDDSLIIQLRLWVSQVGTRLVHGGLDVGSVPYVKYIKQAIHYVHTKKMWNRFDPDELCCMIIVMWFFSVVLFEDCSFFDGTNAPYNSMPVVVAESKSIESLYYTGNQGLEFLDVLMVLIPLSERGSPHLLKAVKLLLGDLYIYIDCPTRCQTSALNFYTAST